MIIRYTTKRNTSGNRYTLTVWHETKTFHRDINDSWTYSDHITVTKSDRNKIIEMLTAAGYNEI